MTETYMTLEEEIENLVQNQSWDKLDNILKDYHPADIADLLEVLSLTDAVTVFRRLPLEVASEVLDEAGGDTRWELLEKVNSELLADLLEELPMDDAVEILEDLPDLISDELMGLMEPEEAEDVRYALGYEKETAGRLMTTEIAALQDNWSVSQTIDHLHELEDVDQLYYLYVLDDNHKLVGVVPLRALLLAKPANLIKNIMVTDVISVPATSDQEELADVLAKYDFAAIPIVDEGNCLVGVVTVDDVIDVVAEEATEDFQRMGGSLPLDRPYFSTPVVSIFKKRIGWLLMLFLAGALTGFVTRFFEPVWSQFLILASFVPLVIGTGGNSGSQTIATIIRAITTQEVKFRNLLQACKREVSTGFLLGLVMSAMALVLSVLVYDTGWNIALVVALTLPAVIIWSTTVGTVVPIVADRINIDPAVISGPMIATIVDVTGLVIYYSLAGIILGVL